jgi:hypothetical protein
LVTLHIKRLRYNMETLGLTSSGNSLAQTFTSQTYELKMEWQKAPLQDSVSHRDGRFVYSPLDVLTCLRTMKRSH